MSAIIHQAGVPARGVIDGVKSSWIVQPCTRCGFELASFDEANPPMVPTADADRPYPWWEVGAEIAVEGHNPRSYMVVREGEPRIGRTCCPADGGESPWRLTQ